MDALRIVAHTPAGYAASDPWSPALDGILAYWALREQIPDEDFVVGASAGGASGQIVDADLPLARETDGTTWWWQVSAPLADVVARHRRYEHRRFDDTAATRYTAARRVQTNLGPYKAYRMPIVLHLTPTVAWHAVGDAVEVRRLLRRCVAIGARTGHGNGRVVRWDVTTDGDSDLARFCRPLPVAFARVHGYAGMEMDWGIRPPGWAIDRRVPCLMPALSEVAHAD